jgi:hypothetical protein
MYNHNEIFVRPIQYEIKPKLRRSTFIIYTLWAIVYAP